MSSRRMTRVVAVIADLRAPALAHDHRQANDGIARRLPVDFREHHVGLGLGEIAAALHGRQLRRIAEHENRPAEREKIAAQLLVHHRAFVDDDELRVRRVAVAVEHEGRLLAVDLLGPVDQRMDRARVGTAARLHDQRRLAGVGGEDDVALDAFRQMARQRRLARAGVAEETEHLPLAPARLQPTADLVERARLFGRPVVGQ